MRERTVQTPQSVRKDGGGTLADPCSLGRLMVEHMQPVNQPTLEQAVSPKEPLTPMGAHAGAVRHREDCTLLMGSTSTWRSSRRTVSCGTYSTVEEGKSERSPSPERKERQRQLMN